MKHRRPKLALVSENTSCFRDLFTMTRIMQLSRKFRVFFHMELQAYLFSANVRLSAAGHDWSSAPGFTVNRSPPRLAYSRDKASVVFIVSLKNHTNQRCSSIQQRISDAISIGLRFSGSSSHEYQPVYPISLSAAIRPMMFTIPVPNGTVSCPPTAPTSFR